MLKICFKEAAKGKNSLSINDYAIMMKNIFTNY